MLSRSGRPAVLKRKASQAGRYELDEAAHTVTHIPDVVLEPGYENQRLVRKYSFQGKSLQLSGTFDYQGQTIHLTLTWAPMEPRS